MTKLTMEIKKENALKLWTSRFGSKQKVKDFSGREIMKAAYADRNSKYGWNIDHILPQSQGGKSAESNLICCHILTNDEKQDSFPCFTANDKKFEIKRVQNHYEIVCKEEKNDNEDLVNFFSAAEGMECFNSLLTESKEPFYSCVSINLKLKDKSYANAISEFVKKVFIDSISEPIEVYFGNIQGGDVYYSLISAGLRNNEYSIFVLNRNVGLKEQVQIMVDTCILVNTYLHSFLGKYILDYVISLATEQVEFEFCSMDTRDVLRKLGTLHMNTNKHFVADELTVINTDLKNKQKQLEVFGSTRGKYYVCDYIYTELDKELARLKQ